MIHGKSNWNRNAEREVLLRMWLKLFCSLCRKKNISKTPNHSECFFVLLKENQERGSTTRRRNKKGINDVTERGDVARCIFLPIVVTPFPLLFSFKEGSSIGNFETDYYILFVWLDFWRKAEKSLPVFIIFNNLKNLLIVCSEKRKKQILKAINHSNGCEY